MRIVAIAAALAMAVGGFPLTGAMAAAPAADEEPPQEKKLCRTERMTGSLTRRTRICMTEAQWRELNARTQKGVTEMQGSASGSQEITNNRGAGG